MAKAPTTPNPSASGDKIKSLDTVMAQIEKAHGKGSIMRLGEDVRPPIEVIPTSSIALDVALGIGGIAIGLAFKDIFENFMAGIMIMIRKPMSIGDVIEVEEG